MSTLNFGPALGGKLLNPSIPKAQERKHFHGKNYVNASIPKEKTGALSFFESFIFDAKADRFECNHPRDDCTRNVILRSFARSRVISVYHGA